MGRDRVRRCWRLLLALVVGVWVFGVPPVDPAAAQEEPGITVTPSSGLRDGDVAQVELTGFAGQGVVLWQCRSSVELPPPGNPFGLLSQCLTDFQQRPIAESPTVEAFTVSELVPGALGPSPPVAHCAAGPGACKLVAWSATNGYLAEAFDMAPSPLTLWPTTSVHAASTIRVFVGGVPGSEVTLAQCARPVAESLAASRCGPATPLVVDASGLTATEAVVAETVPGPAGTFDCVRTNCAMATFDASGDQLGSRDLTVDPQYPLAATVSPPPPEGLVDGQEVEVVVTGRPTLPVDVAQCDLRVRWGSDVDDGPCQVLAELEPIAANGERRVTVPVARDFTGADGSSVHCGRSDCFIIVQADDPDEFLLLDLVFRLNPTVTMSPTSGLLDGQPMTLDGSDLDESNGFRAVRCQGLTEPEPRFSLDLCEDPALVPLVSTDERGALSADLPAAQRFRTAYGAYRYCRADCSLALVRDMRTEYLFGYDMAEGSLALSPASGLEDGQPVAVTGSQLMSSYEGPPVWVFGSGQWSLVQCGREVRDEPSLLGVFTQCARLRPGPVPVPGSDLSTTVEVQASPTAILGDQIDCTAAPEACVVMLVRLEQDGSISMHPVPISFGETGVAGVGI